MAPRYDEAPEVTPQATLPEVHHPPVAPEAYSHRQQASAPFVPVKPEHSAAYTPASTTPVTSYGYGYNPAASGVPSEPGRAARKATICGCSTIVFILSVIIAVLSAAVIGLAAGAGVEASRANDAEAKLAAAVAANSTASATSASTNYNALDRNCSSNSASVSGTSYTSQFFNDAKYTIYCNKDAPNAPLQSLFVGNFDDCMDACSAFSYYMPMDFSNATATNQTCAGVSFIPAWTNRTLAIKGGTPGNCYLHGGPQNRTALRDPNNGSETHAAIVTTS